MTTTERTVVPSSEELEAEFTVTRTENPLIEGTDLTCPNCEQKQNILAFRPLQVSKKYQRQVIPPLKCRMCNHVFALRP